MSEQHAQPEGSSVLSCEGIAKSYGHVDALRGVALTLRPGETTALVGDNGAGKSTLIKILCGVISPDQGVLRINEDPVVFGGPRDARKAGVTAVYQDLALADNLTVAENIFLGRVPTRYWRVDRRRMAREAGAVLAELGINVPSVRARVASLSGGQRQSVAIARAVHDGGRVVILDEPTAALGVQESQKVLGAIHDLRKRGMAVLVVSHNLEHVFQIADEIVVLRGGCVAGVRRPATTQHADIVHMIVAGNVGNDA